MQLRIHWIYFIFFWSISAGIICGFNLVLLAVFLCLAMPGMILVLQSVPNTRASSLIVLHTSADVDWSDVTAMLEKHGKGVKEKSRSHKSGQTEIIYELITKEEDLLIKKLKGYGMIEQINFLAHDGEYRI